MSSKYITLDKKCPECGNNTWKCVDRDSFYVEWCEQCHYFDEYYKTDYLEDFICEECNCFEGKIEENNKFLAVRCTNCGKQHIKLEKHTTVNERDPNAIPVSREVLHKQFEEQQAELNKPKCPKCGCTNIQVVRKKWGMFTGFFTNATERVCAKCNWRW